MGSLDWFTQKVHLMGSFNGSTDSRMRLIFIDSLHDREAFSSSSLNDTFCTISQSKKRLFIR